MITIGLISYNYVCIVTVIISNNLNYKYYIKFIILLRNKVTLTINSHTNMHIYVILYIFKYWVLYFFMIICMLNVKNTIDRIGCSNSIDSIK